MTVRINLSPVMGLLVTVAFCIYYIYFLCTIANVTLVNMKTLEKPASVLSTSEMPIVILLWNKFGGEDDYGVGIGSKVFEDTNCDKKCWITTNKDQLGTATAVVIHTFAMKAHGHMLPSRSRSNQIFVFYMMESPLVAWSSLSDYDFNNVFNLTATYMDQPDTDIVVPLVDIINRSDRIPYPMPSLDFIHQKTGAVAWVVSNCRPSSQRTHYVHQLMKYIPVDIYGDCGTLSCPEGDDYGYRCVKSLSAKYWFYLSFENSLCTDYITEKVFRPLSHDIVPVVYGEGNYSKILPPKSYIDIKRFYSPKELAEHLIYLMDNDMEYIQYFAWKQSKIAVGNMYHRSLGFCQLCQILHQPNYTFKSNFDIQSYWNPTTHCLMGQNEHKRMHIG